MPNSSVTPETSRAAVPFSGLSPETRDALTGIAHSLTRGATLPSLRAEIQTAARACVADARTSDARAERLVRELKQEWNACVLSAGLDRHLADRAIERLVSEAIAEFYRSV